MSPDVKSGRIPRYAPPSLAEASYVGHSPQVACEGKEDYQGITDYTICDPFLFASKEVVKGRLVVN